MSCSLGVQLRRAPAAAAQRRRGRGSAATRPGARLTGALAPGSPPPPGQARDDAPAGVRPEDPVEFEIELVGFEREGYWANLEWAARWALLERLKALGNSLYKAGKHQYAANRCVGAPRGGARQGSGALQA